MWSGPRNISTALMRAWENRPDTVVVDEPFYAHYLMVTGKPHPGRDEVIAAHECDPARVAASMHAALPPGRTIFYQKHMAHHLLPGMPLDWLTGLQHAFLIRDPAEMLLSLDAKLDVFALEDTGLPQQVRIYQQVHAATGRRPPIFDARDILIDPRGMLAAMCGAFGVPFLPESMLSWPPGRRTSDGVWARYWYESVEQSTGFQPYRPKSGALPAHLVELERAARPLYERLFGERVRA
jgi:hypothetical protein